jgi:phosphatidylserine decarboxylase
MSLIADLRIAFPPPHPAGRPFILGGIVALVAGMFLGDWLAWIGAVFTLFCIFFFRDPERVPPIRTGVFVAPADGRIVAVAQVVPPDELDLGPAPLWRVSVFLSVLDVHVNRIPIDSTVTRIAYHHGAFVSASLDKASESNERNAVCLRLADGRNFAVVQIAGLIARRILCDVREGQAVQTGARFGIIRFGSRTDLYLPLGVSPLVSVGQKMVGGETAIAEMAAGSGA